MRSHNRVSGQGGAFVPPPLESWPHPPLSIATIGSLLIFNPQITFSFTQHAVENGTASFMHVIVLECLLNIDRMLSFYYEKLSEIEHFTNHINANYL